MSSGIGQKRGISAVESSSADAPKGPSRRPVSSASKSADPWATYLHPLLASSSGSTGPYGSRPSAGLDLPAGAASEILNGIIATEIADSRAEREGRALFVHERLASQLAYDARVEEALERLETAKQRRLASRKLAAASSKKEASISSSARPELAANSSSTLRSGLHDVDSDAVRVARGTEPAAAAADEEFIEVADGDATAGPGAEALRNPAIAEREKARAAAEGEQEDDDAAAQAAQRYGGRPIRGYTSGALYIGAERACGVPPLRRSGWRDVMNDGAFPLSAFLYMPGADGVGAAAVSARASARSGRAGQVLPAPGLPPPPSVTAAAALAMAQAAQALANGTGPGTARQAAQLLRQPAFPDRGFPLPAYARGNRLARRMAMAADADAAAEEEAAHLEAQEGALAALADRLPPHRADEPFAPLLEALARRAQPTADAAAGPGAAGAGASAGSTSSSASSASTAAPPQSSMRVDEVDSRPGEEGVSRSNVGASAAAAERTKESFPGDSEALSASASTAAVDVDDV